MGRISQFIDYINRKNKPTPEEVNFHNTSLTINEKIDKIRKTLKYKYNL